MLKSISQKLMLTICVLLILSSTTGILMLYRQLSKISENDAIYFLRQAATQTVITINDRMSFAEETLRTLLHDSRFQESMNRLPAEETMANQLVEIKDLRDLVYSTQETRDVDQIRIYLKSEKILSREGINFLSQAQAKEAPEYSLLSTGSGAVWIGEHPVETRFFSASCITLGCIYRSHFAVDGSNWSMVLLDISPKQFTQALDSFELPDEKGCVLIVDTKGRIIAGNGEQEQASSIYGYAVQNGQQERWGFFRSDNHEENAYILLPLKFGSWSFLIYTPRSSLLNSQSALRSTLTALLCGLTLLLVMLIAFCMLAFYARNVRSYINRLNQGLRSFTVNEKKTFKSYNALLSLNRNIDQLLHTNQQLIEENYRSQLREREVTLQALQAQINPHFLYNTLDAINWMAIRDGADDVSDAISTLADYFRVSLSRGLSTVTLRKDADIVKKYLSLYEHRYAFSYNIIWRMSDEALSCLLPKLTLQPLVENAMQHGIFKRKQKYGGVVIITANVENDLLVLTVQDNGPGLIDDTQPEKGYGLRNVQARLELYFMGQYEMRIANAPEGGALVTIKISAKKSSGNPGQYKNT